MIKAYRRTLDYNLEVYKMDDWEFMIISITIVYHEPKQYEDNYE